MAYDIESSINKEGTTRQSSIDRNYSTPRNFRLSIEGDSFSSVEYTIKSVSIPTLTAEAVNPATPFAESPEPGSFLDYGPLELSFLIDEQFTNYHNLHDWIVLNTKVQSGSDVQFDVKLKRDISLLIMSSHFNVIKEIKFIDAFPVSLGTVAFDTSETGIEYLVAQSTFRYSYFKVL